MSKSAKFASPQRDSAESRRPQHALLTSLELYVPRNPVALPRSQNEI
jgi:hypothetical protein